MERKIVVSDTGPLISVFQSKQVKLLQSLYDKVCIPITTLPEYIGQVEKTTIDWLISIGYVDVCELTLSEKSMAFEIAKEIAEHPLSKNKLAEDHDPEAQAIVLAKRQTFKACELLMDELVAREIAKKHDVPIIGFPGILIRCCKHGMISAEQVRDTLLICQSLGTHYATDFIQNIYKKLKEEQPNESR